MIESKDFRNNVITVYGIDGEVITQYSGKIYIYFGDKIKDGCVHFVEENGKHHRIYGDNTIIIDEK